VVGMAFNVQFYTHSKRQNSTAVPTGSGQVYSCRANEPLDLLAPVIRLELAYTSSTPPTVYNYARIPNFSRWYWITGWTMVDGLWEARLRVDPLASWKTQIGANSCYVYRSSYSWDGRVGDSMYPATVRRRQFNINLPKPFTIDGASASGAAANSGVIILGIMSYDGIAYYGFTPSQLNTFMAYLFSDDYYDAVLTQFGAQEYPEAKVAINPMQYIASAKFIPMGVSLNNDWTLHASTITNLFVGTVYLQGKTAYAFFSVEGTPIQFHTTSSYVDITVTEDLLHPQASERGDWLNFAPYTSYELYYPPFGIMQLDPAMISAAETIRVKLTVDVWTATGVLEVITDPGTTSEKQILKVAGPVGADVPLSNIQTIGHSTMELTQHALSAVKSAYDLDAQGFLAAEQAAVKTMVNGWIPHLSTMGSQGSTAQLGGRPRIMVTQWYMANDDLEGRGRPLMAVKQLSTIPGYIQADPEELSIPCTETELEEIHSAVSGGFYYA
jgi:hypothetical protein